MPITWKRAKGKHVYAKSRGLQNRLRLSRLAAVKIREKFQVCSQIVIVLYLKPRIMQR